jgi:succinate dehydrogenase / fumarate reductase, cytochrome b subunit
MYWLVSAASGPTAYAAAQAVFANGITQLVLLAGLFAFVYHFLNGIRHLVWDAGKGFDLEVARKSGIAVLIAAVVLTGVIASMFTRLGGAA